MGFKPACQRPLNPIHSSRNDPEKSSLVEYQIGQAILAASLLFD
jgi:hypothetical protein